METSEYAMYSENDLIALSALQHILFCPRQCALIHLERIWIENRFTAEGRILHEKSDSGESESRAGVRIVRGLPLRSFRLGLIGKADVVEFHRSTEAGSGPGDCRKAGDSSGAHRILETRRQNARYVLLQSL